MRKELLIENKGESQTKKNKEEEHKVEKMAEKYKIYQIKLKTKTTVNIDSFCEDEKNFIHTSTINEKESENMTQFTSYIDKVIEDLSADSRNIIMHDFFGKEKDKKWWVNHYPRTTYYRKRIIAIKDFLNYVE